MSAPVFIFAVFLGCWAEAVILFGAPPASPSANPRTFLDAHCVSCHNQKLRTAGLALESLDVSRPVENVGVWERVIAKLRSGSMPPPGIPRPDAATYRAVSKFPRK